MNIWWILHYENVVQWFENMFVIHEDYYCDVLIRSLSVSSWLLFCVLFFFCHSRFFYSMSTIDFGIMRETDSISIWIPAFSFSNVPFLLCYLLECGKSVFGLHHLHRVNVHCTEYAYSHCVCVNKTLTVNRGLWMECCRVCKPLLFYDGACVFSQVLNFSSRTLFTHAIIQPNDVWLVLSYGHKATESRWMNFVENCATLLVFAMDLKGVGRKYSHTHIHILNGFSSTSKINQQTNM